MYHLVFEGVSVKRKRAIVMYCNCYGLDEQGGQFLILSQHQIFYPPLISLLSCWWNICSEPWTRWTASMLSSRVVLPLSGDLVAAEGYHKRKCVVPINWKGVLEFQAHILSITKVLREFFFFLEITFGKYSFRSKIKLTWHSTQKKSSTVDIQVPSHWSTQRQYRKVFALLFL